MSEPDRPVSLAHQVNAQTGAITRSYSRTEIRYLLMNIFRLDADLTAFIIDWFPQVADRLTDGMNRPSRVNVLLLQHTPSEILGALQKAQPEGLAQHSAHLAKTAPSTDEQRREQVSHSIRVLQTRRAARLQANEETRDIDQELRRLRKEQRQGPQLHETDELSERYSLLERLGSGGFATVWQAYDYVSDALVAVKILHGDQASPEKLERFYSGATQMKKLSSEHIVRVESEPTCDRGFHYFVMEYLPGGDLQKAIKNGMTTGQGLQAVLEIGQALAYMHRCNVIHRDVKPANILLDQQGHAKLSDFDLVRTELVSHGTRTSTPLGSTLYASPEALTDGGSVDLRSDIFSLAKTALFVLHHKELPLSCITDCTELIAKLQCSDVLKGVLRKALAIDPRDRHETVVEFCAALTVAWVNQPKPVSATDIGRCSALGSAERLNAPFMHFGIWATDTEELASTVESRPIEHHHTVPTASESPNAPSAIDRLIHDEIIRFHSLDDLAAETSNDSPKLATKLEDAAALEGSSETSKTQDNQPRPPVHPQESNLNVASATSKPQTRIATPSRWWLPAVGVISLISGLLVANRCQRSGLGTSSIPVRDEWPATSVTAPAGDLPTIAASQPRTDTKRAATLPDAGSTDLPHLDANATVRLKSKQSSPSHSTQPIAKSKEPPTNQKLPKTANTLVASSEVPRFVQPKVKPEEEDTGTDEGVPGGVVGGPPPLPQEEAKPLPKPKLIPFYLIKKDKISFNDDPHLPDVVKAQRRGTIVTGAYKVCIAQSGNISLVEVVQGIPGADDAIMATLRTWRYKPQAIQICFIQHFEFHIDVRTPRSPV